MVLALRIWICSPMVGAISCTTRNVDSTPGLAGLRSTATRTALGTKSCRSRNRFAVSSALIKLIPVALAPGRAKLATIPSLTGSEPTPKTIGIVAVAALAASVGTLPVVAITATCRCKRSASNFGKRSCWPSSQWYSTVTFWPSMVPVSLRPLRNAATYGALPSPDPSRINPTTGSAGCCARAPSGHATAAPPTVNMNSRRRRWIAMRPLPPEVVCMPIESTISRFAKERTMLLHCESLKLLMSLAGQSRSRRCRLQCPVCPKADSRAPTDVRPGAPKRSEQARHLQERPRAQEQDQASDQHHQQPVRYDLDQVAGERRADEPADHQRDHRREIAQS